MGKGLAGSTASKIRGGINAFSLVARKPCTFTRAAKDSTSLQQAQARTTPEMSCSQKEEQSQAKLGRRAAFLTAASVIGAAGAGLTLGAEPALAGLKDYNIDADAPIDEVSVVLGSADGDFVFSPSRLEFTQGRVTKLKMTNPSSVTHYFTALEFADKVRRTSVMCARGAWEGKD